MPIVSVSLKGEYALPELKTKFPLPLLSEYQSLAANVIAALPSIVAQAMCQVGVEVTEDEVLVLPQNMSGWAVGNVPDMWIKVSPMEKPELLEAQAELLEAVRSRVFETMTQCSDPRYFPNVLDTDIVLVTGAGASSNNFGVVTETWQSVR